MKTKFIVHLVTVIALFLGCTLEKQSVAPETSNQEGLKMFATADGQEQFVDGIAGTGYTNTVLAYTPVSIDIKPGSVLNFIKCINLREVITVAILTTDDFDARTVDHNTVIFEGASEIHVNKDYETRRHEEDIDGDGKIDLLFHFRLENTTLTCTSTEGTLTGETFDGIPITGSDVVNMIDTGNK